MSTTRSEPVDSVPAAALGRGLGVGGIVYMVVAAAAPMTVIIATLPLMLSLSGTPLAPLYFIAAGAVLAVFSVGFTTMSKHVRNAGAFYSYIQTGLGRVAGVGAAFLALASYVALFMALVAYVGVGSAGLVSDYAGADVSWWVFSLAALVLLALLGFRDIELSSRVLAVVLISEVLSVLVLDAGILVAGGRDGLSLEPFDPSGLGEGTPVTGLLFAFLAYIGFEATAVFRNEARDPDRTIPRATYAAVACIATFYALSSWLVVVGAGVDSAVEKSTADPVNFVFTVAGDYVSPVLGDVMQVLIVTSFFACTLSFHNVIARYLFTLAGAGVMPAALARVHDKHQSPARASLATTVITTVAFAVLLALGWDPLVQIYTWLAGASTLGLIALMAVTSLAVLVYFRRTDSDRRVWHTLVAPLLALIGLLVATWLVIDNFALLTGGDTAAVVLGATVAGVFVAGMVTALLIRVFSPQSYQRLLIADADQPVPTPVLEDDK